MGFYPLVWLLGLGFALIRGNFFTCPGIEVPDIDLWTIIIGYTFLFYSITAVSIFAFGQGLLIDLFSGGPQGLHAFLYLAIMARIYAGSRFFDLQTPVGQVFLVSSAVLLKKIMFFLLLMLFSQKIILSDSCLFMAVLSIICTGLITPVLFYIFNRLRSVS